jgi:RNA polymerase sigma-70 factor (ECF subfamily)
MSRSLEEFDRLFRDYYRPIFHFFRNRGFSPQEAEELAQETFLQAHKSWQSFRGESSSKTWLFGIAKNIWCNDLRAQGRLKRASAEEVPLEVLEDEGSLKVPTTETEGLPSPLDDALAAERERSVRTAVGELPETQRQALTLQLDQELKYREIAELLHEPMDRVKSWLYQGRQKIKSILERQFGPDGY